MRCTALRVNPLGTHPGLEEDTMIRTRIALTLITTTALLGLTTPASAVPPPLGTGPVAACDGEPSMVLTLGHLHRWYMTLDDAVPGPC